MRGAMYARLSAFICGSTSSRQQVAAEIGGVEVAARAGVVRGVAGEEASGAKAVEAGLVGAGGTVQDGAHRGREARAGQEEGAEAAEVIGEEAVLTRGGALQGSHG